MIILQDRGRRIYPWTSGFGHFASSRLLIEPGTGFDLSDGVPSTGHGFLIRCVPGTGSNCVKKNQCHCEERSDDKFAGSEFGRT